MSADLDAGAVLDLVEARVLGGPRRYARAEVAARSGVDPAETRRMWQALGFATVGDDEQAFTDSDVRALEQVRFLTENGLADDELRLAMARMLGQSFARLAASQGQLLAELLATRPDLLSTEDGIPGLIDELLPVLEQLQNYVWRRQLVAYFARVAARASTEPVDAARAAVGFADLTGFTALTRRSSEAELRELLEAFESTATDVVGAHGGRVVKTIGDEVLFVTDTAPIAAETALALIEAAEADARLPPLRIGLAAGPVIERLGDVYGETVNIASRLTALSRPGSVLVDRELAETLRGDQRYAVKSQRPESVRGYHHLHSWRLRRADPAIRRR